MSTWTITAAVAITTITRWRPLLPSQRRPRWWDSIVHSVPSGCQTVVVNGFAYQQCGITWYQPQMSGSSTIYIVVNPPR